KRETLLGASGRGTPQMARIENSRLSFGQRPGQEYRKLRIQAERSGFCAGDSGGAVLQERNGLYLLVAVHTQNADCNEKYMIQEFVPFHAEWLRKTAARLN